MPAARVHVERGLLERRVEALQHAGQRQVGYREHAYRLYQHEAAEAVDREVVHAEQLLGYEAVVAGEQDDRQGQRERRRYHRQLRDGEPLTDSEQVQSYNFV